MPQSAAIQLVCGRECICEQSVHRWWGKGECTVWDVWNVGVWGVGSAHMLCTVHYQHSFDCQDMLSLIESENRSCVLNRHIASTSNRVKPKCEQMHKNTYGQIAGINCTRIYICSASLSALYMHSSYCWL